MMKRPKFPWEGKAEEIQIREIQQMHRRVFGTEEGRQVLTMLLEDLYYFDVATTPEQVALKNYATSILRKFGAVDHFDVANAAFDAVTKQEP